MAFFFFAGVGGGGANFWILQYNVYSSSSFLTDDHLGQGCKAFMLP